jgi:7-cyano-7-deazaguanine synthase
MSGGMDSATLAYMLADEGHDIHLLSFDYGQRHKKELEYSALLAAQLGARHDVIMLGVPSGGEGFIEMLGPALFTGASTLTDPDIPVPEGHYASETMKITVVPNRNAIMLSIAYGVAVAENAGTVAFGAHAGDHAIYPDCRPEFVGFLDRALRSGNEWADPVPTIYAPFLSKSKADIALLGTELHVPFHMTWSCYKGGKIHCGKCGTCVERKEAFRLAGVEDPTAYEDYDFMG